VRTFARSVALADIQGVDDKEVVRATRMAPEKGSDKGCNQSVTEDQGHADSWRHERARTSRASASRDSHVRRLVTTS
jgi:hypothetical protein